MRLLPGLLLAALIGASTCTPASAAPPFSSKHFVYHAEGKKLSEVFQDFAASENLPVVVDAGVDGTVNADFNARPEEFLNAMSRTYGIIWYFDGTTLFIYPASAMQSRVFRMRGYDRAQVHQMLESLGLGDARFPLRFDDANQTLLAYGPPRHIELVSTLLGELERNGRDRIGKSIQVFPLRFATAGDRSAGNDQIPGLASTLNNLFSAGAPSATTPAKTTANSIVGHADRAKAAQLTYGMQLGGATDAGTTQKAADNPKATPLAGPDQADAADVERPYFQAEEATNSIIVRGLPDRMKEYETLIHQLDLPHDMVEIEASIIDVSTDDFESLGIDWNYAINGVTRFSISPGSPPTSVGGAPSELLTGTNITTLIGGGAKQLLASIRALEGKGKAHVIARPKVLGSVNRTATMSDKQTASVRVSGNLDANLFTIETGTTLKVTPQVVVYPDHREVHLSLTIQDGDFEGTLVDAVPVIKQTEIDTEATVREGESLLIGGISVEQQSKSDSAVPLLGRLPLLGQLFRHDENNGSKTERMFLLTPKVITADRTRGLASAQRTEAPGAAAAAVVAAPAASAAIASPPSAASAPDGGTH